MISTKKREKNKTKIAIENSQQKPTHTRHGIVDQWIRGGGCHHHRIPHKGCVEIGAECKGAFRGIPQRDKGLLKHRRRGAIKTGTSQSENISESFSILMTNHNVSRQVSSKYSLEIWNKNAISTSVLDCHARIILDQTNQIANIHWLWMPIAHQHGTPTP
jgi:hypothetical protein